MTKKNHINLKKNARPKQGQDSNFFTQDGFWRSPRLGEIPLTRHVPKRVFFTFTFICSTSSSSLGPTITPSITLNSPHMRPKFTSKPSAQRPSDRAFIQRSWLSHVGPAPDPDRRIEILRSAPQPANKLASALGSSPPDKLTAHKLPEISPGRSRRL